MISRIIELSVRNRLIVLLLTAFVVAAGIWATAHIGLDAIPDLSDVQVIIVTDYPGQAPNVVESQVTYPLTTKMMGIPRAKVVRGQSMFELSFVYVIFEDGTDLYWARSRVLEYLNSVRGQLPAGVEPRLGPDATGVGWVYQYVLYPGYYCPEHPNGIWHDEKEDRWYGSPIEAPAKRQAALKRVRAFEGPGACPLDGTPLVSSNQNIATLRSLQDWYLRYQLTAVPNVAEVASIGGFVKEYQVVLKPQRLLAYDLPVGQIVSAIGRSNSDVGGSVVEMGGNEYMVRSRGYFGTPHGGKPGDALADLGNVTVGVDKQNGTPIRLKDVATLQIAGAERRGVGEWNGRGEAVGGVVVARYGANAYQVIHDARAKLAELENGLPPGVTIKTAYDRSELIERSIHTLRETLLEEMLVVSLVCVFFLLHGRSALVAIFVIPSSMLVSMLAMHLLGVNANIMSLGGIAIAIGVVVDSAIVMVENAHKHLAQEEERVTRGGEPRPRVDVILEAAKEVGPSLFFSLLIITVSFLPIFVLVGEEGKLFKPLAFTKTFAMAAAAVLSITIIPVLMSYFISARVLPRSWGRWVNLGITLAAVLIPAATLLLLPDSFSSLAPYRWWLAGGWIVLAAMLLAPQRIVHEERNPISRALQKVYNPFFWGVLKLRWPVLILATAFVASAAWPFLHIGSELMPRLDEGDLLYMPTTDPSISITEARHVLQQTDKLLKTFPEVVSVDGKIGRAESATDPAPLDMVETVVRLQTDPAKWRRHTMHYWFDRLPNWLTWPLHHTFWPGQRPITMDELIYGWTDADGSAHPGMNAAVSFPGLANAWPMPIENRTNMLSTGIKTPVGIKIMGPDLSVLSDLAQKTSLIVRSVPGTTSAYAERTMGGYYLDIDPRPEQISRYGLNVRDVQDVVETAIGGMSIATTVEGLERYPVNVRYARDLRGDPYQIKQILVPTPAGAQIPIGQLADIRINPGPPMIRSENTRQSAWVFVDMSGRDLGSYIADAQKAIASRLELPTGYTLAWSGQYEIVQQNATRWKVAGLIALVVIVLLLYAASRSWLRTLIVLLAVPFSVVGAMWFLWVLGYNWSGAVIVGLIALAGLDAETGIVMLLYLDNSFERFKSQGRMKTDRDLRDAIHDGAVKRIRPKTMTVAAAFIGLVPLMWATGTGADVMRRIAAPMLGGLFTSFLMELLIYPILFYVAKRWAMRPRFAATRRESLSAAFENGSRLLSKSIPVALGALVLIGLTGCTIHPAGEAAERRSATDLGRPYHGAFENRHIPLLPENPTPEDLVHLAMLTNAGLEQKYWEWRAAIEQIPQDGTQASTLALSGGMTITKGRTGARNSMVSALNDPMTDLHWPGTLATAAQRALENARAAGMRFRQAGYELRQKVLNAYYDYALTCELIRLEQSNVQLLETTVTVVEARNRAGSAGQADLLKARNELDLARNDLAAMEAQLPAERGALNALLSRAPDASLPAPAELPTVRSLASNDQQVLDLAASRNPELGALADEIRGRKEGIQLARLQYVPDFDVSIGTDLMGIAQSIVGTATIPLLRYEAINAAIAQAQANLRASRSMLRQAHNDLNARVVLDLSTLRDADRQLELLDYTILPRARQVVTVARSAYEAGQASLLELLDGQRTLIALGRLIANLRTTREKQLADLESITAARLDRPLPANSAPASTPPGTQSSDQSWRAEAAPSSNLP